MQPVVRHDSEMLKTSSADCCGPDERNCPTQGCREMSPEDRAFAYPPPPHAVRVNGLETFVPSRAKNRSPSPHTRICEDIARSVLPPRIHSRAPILRTEEAHRSDPAKAFHRECSPVSEPGPRHQRGARREGRCFQIRCSCANHKARIDPEMSPWRLESRVLPAGIGSEQAPGAYGVFPGVRDAERLKSLPFTGYYPHFESDEPPGL